jgi:hypothetical protein
MFVGIVLIVMFAFAVGLPPFALYKARKRVENMPEGEWFEDQLAGDGSDGGPEETDKPFTD